MDAPPDPPRSWQPTFGVLVLCVVPMLLFFPVLFEGRALYLLDISWFHYPSRVFAKRLVLNGELPLWNPHILCGFPMHAEGQLSISYPASAMFLLPMPTWQLLSWFVVGHYVLAALGAYALARALGVSAVGGTLAGLTFGFSGYAMAQVPHVNMVIGLAWLPWALLAARRAARTGTWPAAAALAGVLGVQTLGSHPQVSFFTIIIVPVFGFVEVWRSRSQGRAVARGMRSVVAPLLFAAALSAAQILPTVELKTYSPRAGGLSYEALTERSLPPRDLLTFLSPHLFGTPLAGYMGQYDYFQYGYVGALTLVLAVVGATRAREGAAAFFLGLSLAALLLALGGHTPLYRALAAVPGFNWFRAPERWLGPLGLSLAMLAGMGWDALLQRRGRTARWCAWAACLAGLACVAAAAWGWLARPALERYALSTMIEAWGGHVPGFMLRRIVDGAIRSAALSAVCWAFAALLCAAMLKGLRRGPAALIAIVLAALDLSIFGSALTAKARATYLTDKPKAAALLQGKAGLHRFCPTRRGDVMARLRENVPSLYGLYSVSGHLGQIAPTRSVRLARAASENRAVCNVMGVRYVLGVPRARPGRFAAGPPRPRVVENREAWPRCIVASHVRQGLTGEEVFAEMLTGRVRRHEVLLERTGPWAGAVGTARVTRYAPHRVEVDASLDSDGLVVLSDTWQPGWRAYVDGRRAPVAVANYVFRAVPVPRGQRRLCFVYAPRAFGFGVFLSLLAMAAVVALWAGQINRGSPRRV